MAAEMTAVAQKNVPAINSNVSIKNCDIVWSRGYSTQKTIGEIFMTIKMEGLFENVDTLPGVVYGTIMPFKVPYEKATVRWMPIWLIDPVTAVVQIRQKADGYNVLFKKIKTVAGSYKGEIAKLPEENLLNKYALKNCEFIKSFVKQGCTDMIDDGFDKKVIEILH